MLLTEYVAASGKLRFVARLFLHAVRGLINIHHGHVIEIQLFASNYTQLHP